MQTKYSKRFKIEAVRKVLLRYPGTTIISVARSLDVKMSTLHGWIKSMKNKDLHEELKEPPTSGEEIEKSNHEPELVAFVWDHHTGLYLYNNQ